MPELFLPNSLKFRHWEPPVTNCSFVPKYSCPIAAVMPAWWIVKLQMPIWCHHLPWFLYTIHAVLFCCNCIHILLSCVLHEHCLVLVILVMSICHISLHMPVTCPHCGYWQPLLSLGLCNALYHLRAETAIPDEPLAGYIWSTLWWMRDNDVDV